MQFLLLMNQTLKQQTQYQASYNQSFPISLTIDKQSFSKSSWNR